MGCHRLQPVVEWLITLSSSRLEPASRTFGFSHSEDDTLFALKIPLFLIYFFPHGPAQLQLLVDGSMGSFVQMTMPIQMRKNSMKSMTPLAHG
jgi:hypothetical protein